MNLPKTCTDNWSSCEDDLKERNFSCCSYDRVIGPCLLLWQMPIYWIIGDQRTSPVGFFSVTGFEFLQLMIYLDFNDQQKYHLQNAYPNDVSCTLEHLLPCFNLYLYFVRLSRAIAQFYLLTCESGPWLNNTCTMLVKYPS